MEPVTTSVLIATVVTYLAKTFSDSKSFEDFTNEFSNEVINWIKPIFLKPETKEMKQSVELLKEKPSSKARFNGVKSLLEIELEENDKAKTLLEKMVREIKAKNNSIQSIATVINSKNVNTGSVNTGGGDFILGGKKNV